MHTEAHDELVRFQSGTSRDLCNPVADLPDRLNASPRGGALRVEGFLQKECTRAVARMLADNTSPADDLLIYAKDQTPDERKEGVCRESAGELCGALEVDEHDGTRPPGWPQESEHPFKRRVIARAQQRDHPARKTRQRERDDPGEPSSDVYIRTTTM